jgi:UDP-2,3-diacylglucosamine pyrophosphatase LpxH
MPTTPTTYYLISDLHIGGDGGLSHCEFESELVGFLREIAAGPLPAELIIVGDAFGFWELTDREGVSKLEVIAAMHPALFRQLRETGERVTITLLPGNHDYDLACVPGYRAELARYNVRLEPVVHITREIAGHTVWIEHGNQYDDFNRFPDFGNRWGLPLGYFVTRGVVAAAARTAERTHTKWLDDVQSVYPNEDIPFWVLSNHFYKEMTPVLRWGLLPFLLLFTLSAAVLAFRGVEWLAGRPTSVFDIDLTPILGFPGRIIDLVQFVNSTVIVTLLVLAVPLYLLLRDARAAAVRYGLGTSEREQLEKDAQYVAAARRIFTADPSVGLFVYGHTHIPSLREVDGRYVINTGTWLKRLEYLPVRLGRLPGVFVPSYQLNYFELSEADGEILVRYRVIPKTPPKDLTLLERILIVGRHTKALPAIPAETRAGRAHDGVTISTTGLSPSRSPRARDVG